MMSNNKVIQTFLVKALLGLPIDKELELFATIHQKLQGLGEIIREKNPELFEEIIRYYDSASIKPKTRLEIKNKLQREFK